jgi:IS5 family transposase
MLAGFLLGIVNDRKLMNEAQVNLAIRWFCGFRLDQVLPDHSSLTRIRQRWGTETFEKCFRRIVRACHERGLISAETIHIDSTLIRADVSWDSVVEKHVQRVLKVNATASRTVEVVRKEITTDPDATLATYSRGRHLEPSYKNHLAVDDRAGVIVDVRLTTGTVNEGDEILSQLTRIESLLSVRPVRVTADAGYAYGKVYAGLERQGIEALIPPKRVWSNKKVIPLHQFKYDAKHEVVKCPWKKPLHRTSRCKHGWYYKSTSSDCHRCPDRDRCLSPAVNRRTVVISETYPELLRARRRRERWTNDSYRLYTRHRWRVEGVHAEGKCLHGLRRAVRRRIENMDIQNFLTASAINVKRIATFT